MTSRYHIVRLFTNSSLIIKMLFVVAVPLTMLTLMMFEETKQALHDKASMQTMLQAVNFSEVTAVLMDGLQKERGMSSGFLSSDGKKFSGQLKIQQRAVNKAFAVMKGSIEKNRPLMDTVPSLHTIVGHLMGNMDRLESVRQGVGKLDIPVDDERKYFTDMINDLMRLSNTIRIAYTFRSDSGNTQSDHLLIVPNARFSGLLSSVILLEEAGEAAGVERAVLSYTFGLGRFRPGMYDRFVSLVSRQRHSLHEFSLQSPAHIQRIFSSLYDSKAVTKVEKFRSIAINRARQGGFNVDPEQWFSVSSKQIKSLQRVEGEIIKLIKRYSREGVERADNHALSFILGGGLTIVTGSGLSIWIAWLLITGIRRANTAVKMIETGEYHVPVVIKGNDEMGRMLASVENMRLSLVATEEARAKQEKKARSRLEMILRTQDELHRKRDLIKCILEAIPSILIVVDSKGYISMWNGIAEKTFGLSGEAVISSVFSSLAIAWDWEEINRSMAESATLYTSSLDHVKFRRLDGTDGFLGMTINAVIEDGQHNGFLIIGADKTEHMQFENQLQMAQKMESMGELAAGIAHEINTPMQYIGDNVRFLKDGFADLLRLISRYHLVMEKICEDKMDSDIKQAEEDADLDFLREEVPMAVTQALEGVVNVSKIVSAMKELSHPGTGDKMLIDINKTIENTVTVSRNEWKYVADLDMELDPDLPMIYAMSEINQVFLNIIVNAAHAIEEMHPEAGDEKGKIRITTLCVDEMVEIRISDTGPGIASKIQDKIFDPFFTTKDPGKGTGQGLAISHQIVCQRLGGRLFIESEPGQGACFIICLPVGMEDGETEIEIHDPR